ncbi:MAG: hypothetical protein EOP84_01205 [Verrucomicrobiaceae bacterium]|nr:MAG: hypothetical protein EOP84_01205 [Verrucomicrobiaceae bacterium]
MLVDLEGKTETIKTDGAPGGVTLHPKGRYAFVTLLDKAAVAIVDLEKKEVAATVKVETSPDGIAYSPVESK